MTEFEQAIEILKTGDESVLREFKTPWPKTPEELTAIITAVTKRKHDYGTVVYAMSISAEAAFNYVAYAEGCTGFQASIAELDFLRRSRGLEGPFAIIKGHDMLYPQYDIKGKVDELLGEWRPWAKEEAQKLLGEERQHPAHPEVEEHWRKLAA